MKISPDIVALAKRHSQYKGPSASERLLLGMAAEHARLGALPLLVIAQQAICDYDGWHSVVYLLKSFDKLPSATTFADDVTARLRDKHASATEKGQQWHDVDDPKLNAYAPKFEPAAGCELALLYDAVFGFKERAGWDSKYTAIRIIGDFRTAIVSDTLYDALGVGLSNNVNLDIYFENVGEASMKGLPMPQPD